MDRVTVVRSLTHPYPIHGVAFALTGTPTIDGPMELNPRDPRHHPFLGSVVDFLQRRGRQGQAGVPNNVALPPFPFSSQAAVGEVARAPAPMPPSWAVLLQPRVDLVPRSGDGQDHQDARATENRSRRAVHGHIAPGQGRFALSGGEGLPPPT